MENKKIINPSKRVTKSRPIVSSIDRKDAIEKIMVRLLMGELNQGEALKELRIKILGLKQDSYAHLVKISRKTLSEIENNKGNYSIEIINKVFRPFGLKLNLMPASPHILFSLLKKANNTNE